MRSLRAVKSVLFVCAVFLLAGCATESNAPEAPAEAPAMPSGNPITGEGLPNPAPSVTANWGTLPEGREWGSTAGIDIDPIDGHIWAYERCGAGNFGAGASVNCDNNPVDPIFKFDRSTAEVPAN